jgi:hypothetical protein
MSKRAIRRHHIERLKHNRKNYGTVVTWYDGVSAEELEGKVSFAVDTPCPCSCHMCGNPRKHWDEEPIRDQRKKQEDINNH